MFARRLQLAIAVLTQLSISVVGFNASTALSNEPQASQGSIDFNRDIRPILSQACFRCHGFDANTRAADLRLDEPAGAFSDRDGSGAAIVPGASSESLLWHRIVSSNSDEVMPPVDSNRQLSDDEKELLKRWIDEGAVYQKHWAFNPIATSFDKSNIDEFLNAQLDASTIPVNEMADPVTRLRRLAFTLKGLPPTLEEVQRFVQDPSAANYERFVDNYLASANYGEEMAKHWLDLARYGDTHGLHLDNERSMWAYRDWVIQAFNRNQPFDQFTIDQVAGDLRPNATDEQWVATGFNRCNVTTGEGGAIDSEFLFRYAVDRTSTTVQTWLGLTAGCAVCHDHKYDPLTTKEFYSLYSFFYSSSDPAMDGNVAQTNPFRKLPTPEQTKDLKAAEENEHLTVELLRKLASDRVARTVPNVAHSDDKSTHQTGSRKWLDDEMPIHGGRHNTSRNAEVWLEDSSAPMGHRSLYQSFGDRYEQTISPEWPVQYIPQEGILSLWVKVDRLEPPKAISISVKAGDKSKRWSWANSEQDHALIGGGSVLVGPLPKPGQWTQLQVSLSELPADSVVQNFTLGLFGGNCSWDGIVSTGKFAVAPQNEFLVWWESQKAKGQPWMPAELQAAFKEGPQSEAGKSVADKLEDYFYAYVCEDVSDDLRLARVAWEKARVEKQIAESRIVGTLVFTDLPTPRETFVMSRGQYDAPGEAVTPATPSFLPPLVISEGVRPNRLDLANWLVQPDNPLVARVAANRFWQQVFGTGIVRSSDDFGIQGTPPTHPELLDFLASQFQKSGWDVKKLMKQLVMTEAFQRSSVITPVHKELDPANLLLARGPRIRLDAEQIRDNVLASSGLLNYQMGGVGFKSYQPPNIWEPIGYGDSNTRYYIQDHGDSIYRRSVYAFIKRTAPPPFLNNFDAPNREQFCSVRGRSNTPLQALQLMNDMQYLEAARVMAEGILSGEKDAPNKPFGSTQQIHLVMERALSRPATDAELSLLENAFGRFSSSMSARAQDAVEIANWGEKPRKITGRDQEIASLALLINLVFNLDEFVNRN